MLNGFTLDEKWVSLPEDDGEVKTEFALRSIPSAKYDEIKATAFDMLRAIGTETTGADLARSRAHNREVVRWGVRAHRNGEGGLASCKTEKRIFAGQEFEVLSDETLTVYERTQVASEPVLKDDGEKLGERPVFLLERLARLVHEAQTLSLAERRGLRGGGVAGS